MGGFHLFTLANVPVWISPWFLIIPLWVIPGTSLARGLIITACITLSLLVHEFGHALVARRYKLAPQIILHGFGGTTQHHPARTHGQEALIVVTGPLAGLGLGVASAALLFALLPAPLRSLENVLALVRPGGVPGGAPMTIAVLSYLAFINALYTAFNLLPLYPMDGGQLFRLGMLKLMKPVSAERATHAVGLLVILGLAYVVYQLQVIRFGPITLLIIGLMAMRNIQGFLNPMASMEPVRRDNAFARELFANAERAYEAGDDDEAARLCHQIRAENNVPPQVLARTWAMLGVIATRKGEFEEALSYLRRAPDLPDVVEATAQCFYQLEMYEALTALTQTKAFTRLPSDTREQILTALREATA